MSIIQGGAKTGASRGFYPLTIDQSLRFNDNDSAYLSRTPASAGNRKTWTWSGWVKRGNLGIRQGIFTAATTPTTDRSLIEFEPDDTIRVGHNVSSVWYLASTASVYRDASAWYHIVLAYDLSNATAADRVKLYVNGEQVSFTSSPFTDLNAPVNNTVAHQIGSYYGAYATGLDGYLAEVHFCDGTAYDETAFGEFKSGVWVAKAPSVTYGTNGFYLDFANSADIGNDVSGEGNDWTPNNFTASDVVLDSPTDNFCTLNPLAIGANSSQITYSNGNLNASWSTASGYAASIGTFGMSSGQWYWEVTNTSTANSMIGVLKENESLASYVGQTSGGYSWYSTGSKYNSGSGVSYGSAYAQNDVVGVALDMDAGTITFYKNGVSQGEAYSGLSGTFFPAVSDGDTSSAINISLNFGQLGFTYTPPTGYLALSTANLPDPVIDPAQDESPSDYFNTVLYTGTGSTQSITGVGFQPDWVWIKQRTQSYNHALYDVVRGDQKELQSSTTNSETTESQGLLSLDSDGFTVGTRVNINQSSTNLVAWNWKANGSGVTNTDGSITSTVSANTTSGFSIVSSVGTGAAGTTGHGLGVKPAFIIRKSRTSAFGHWYVYHHSVGASSAGILQLTNAFAGATAWNSTEPTSTVFSVGSAVDENKLNDNYITYVFAEVEGFSKFGSYVGNGSADGPFVYCGFRPAWVMVKRSSSTGAWLIKDIEREYTYSTSTELAANYSNAEGAIDVNYKFDSVSNGFKLRNSGADYNGSGSTYIYMAFAENPFKYSNAR